MSFPRAKIQRFNDVLNSVPSPTKYDPKIGDKVKGGCILKGDTRPATFSDTASATSNKSCSTPVFRTPQLPRRHNCLGTGTSEKENHCSFKSISFKPEDLEFLNQDAESEELKALRVECANKTETISDMEKHIQELQTLFSDNEKQKIKLEAYIGELETAKSNLECMAEKQTCEEIIHLKEEIQKLKTGMEGLVKEREYNSTKLEEAEKRNNKLEELNLDLERKIISVEGTLEQLEMEMQNKETLLKDMREREKNAERSHRISIECLQGKISTLENEMKEMEWNKSKIEATVFGFETEISKLNCHIEKLKSEKSEIEKISQEVKLHLQEMETSCKTQNDMITGLEMELGSRVEELHQFKNNNAALKTDLEKLKSEIDKQKIFFEEKLQELVCSHEQELTKLNEKYKDQENLNHERIKDIEEESINRARKHAEEVLKLQNDYESKLLAQMQENTDKINQLQCQLDEKDSLLKQANAKHVQIVAEWKKKLMEAEEKLAVTTTNMESERLDQITELKRSYSNKIKAIEANSLAIQDKKNNEIDILTKQYKEILAEVNGLLKDLEKKDSEIQKLNGKNATLSSRVKMMLEEILLLNSANEKVTAELKEMTAKYDDEFNKNKQLSCKLGELDSKVSQLKKSLKNKDEEWRRVSDELKKTQKTKLHLEGITADLQSRVNDLIKESMERKAKQEQELHNVNEELMVVKAQCRKFEIVTGNTRKSLEAVQERLIESEKEVEKLEAEKADLRGKIIAIETEKGDLNAKCEDLSNTKLALETALDEYLTSNKELSERYSNLESLCQELEVKVQTLTTLNEELEKENQRNVKNMSDLIRRQELELIETERATLDQVEKVSQVLTDKLEFFMKFSSEKVRNLTAELKAAKKENENLAASLKAKTEEHDNLVTDNEILKTTVEIAVKESQNLKKLYEEQYEELVKLENSVVELKSDQKSVEEKLSAKELQYSEMLKETENLKELLKQNNAETEELRRSKSKIEDQVANLKMKIGEEKMRVENKEKELEGLMINISDLEMKIQEKQKEVESCQTENAIFKNEIENLSAENGRLLDELEKKESIEKQHKNEMMALIAQKNTLESELRSIQEEQEKLKSSAKALEEVEERKNYYKSSCLKLDKLCSELTQENSSLKNDFNEIHSVLQEKDKTLEELQKRCKDLESLIGPFREQLEQYENERLLIENDREQLRKQHLEQAAKLGHQNHKQKIQHVVNLKNTLLETRKENEKLTLELKNMKKKIQKLQEELGQDPKRLFIGGKRPSSTPFKGKENTTLLTPTAGIITPMTQVKQEPMSPGSPLRNRNQ